MSMLSKKSPIRHIFFYYRPDMPHAAVWEKRISLWIKKNYPAIQTARIEKTKKIPGSGQRLLFVLGGDGAMLEAARTYQKANLLLVGLNLGNIGFLSSIRKSRHFLKEIKQICEGAYRIVPRMMIQVDITRKNKKIFSSYALNEIAVQNLFGMTAIDILINRHIIQRVRGSGVIVATATGSTAYNLSAHGPIVMPDIKCFIITKLLDHNIPTPSIIVKKNNTVELIITGFRKTDKFLIKETHEPADVILAADSERIIPLQKHDRISIKKSERLIRFMELEDHHFFKSLQEKFSFH